MASAERTTVGQENPVDRLFDGVPHTDAPQIDRSAMRAACGEHGVQAPVFAALPVEVAEAFRKPCPAATFG